jgi:hypothetical protein
LHIKTVSFSGAVSHSFGSDSDPIFTSEFDNYKIVISNLFTATSGLGGTFRLRANTTDLSGAVYTTQRIDANNLTLDSGRQVSQTSASLGGLSNIGPSLVIIEMTNPVLATNTTWTLDNVSIQSATDNRRAILTTIVANTNSYNGFTITTAQNFSGTMSAFGYKK